MGDFPGGTVDKNPPANAGGPGLIPGQGTKIPHDTIKTQVCLHSSYPFHCSSFFISSVMENLSASLEVLVDSCSVIVTLVCPWEEVSSGSSYSSILATFLPKIGFLYAYAMQTYVSIV